MSAETTTNATDNPLVRKRLPKDLLIWALCVACVPAVLGVIFIVFQIYETVELRGIIFRAGWAVVVVLFIIVAMRHAYSPIRNIRLRSPLLMGALIVLMAMFAFSYFARGFGDAELLQRHLHLFLMIEVGFASYFLAQRMPQVFPTIVVAALGAGAVLHLPTIAALIYLEADNPLMNWSLQLPGYTGVRPYNYTVEISIALGLGWVGNARRLSTTSTVLGFLGLSVLWAALWWAGGRGAVVGILGAILALTFLWRSSAIKLWLVTLTTSAAGAALSTLVWAPRSGSFGFTNGLSRSAGSNVSSGRTRLWADGYNHILEGPIFGHGFGNSVWPQHKHLHNFVLDAAHSFGIIGFIAIMTLLCGLIYRLISARNQLLDPISQALLLGLGALMIHGLLSGTYYHVHGQFYLALLMGTLLAKANLDTKRPDAITN